MTMMAPQVPTAPNETATRSSATLDDVAHQPTTNDFCGINKNNNNSNNNDMGMFGNDQALLDFRPPSAASSSSSPSTIHSCGTEEQDDDDIMVFQPKDYINLDPSSVQPNDIDSLVAKQLAELSMQDRERVYYDIHGVNNEQIQESPEFIASKLKEFEWELCKLRDLTAYHTAFDMSPDYVQNPAFRLAFLRADLFDAHRAALRFARHWQAKLDLFGKDLLVKTITQDDLDQETLTALYSGYMQYLPLPDRSGRIVHVSFQDRGETSLASKLKRTYYTSMVSSEDEESQRRGRVGVAYLLAKKGDAPPQNHWQVGTLLNALPIRMEAIHLCYDQVSLWTPIFAIFKYTVTWFTKLRIREHFGTHKECMFKLQTFGIHVRDCFPFDEEKGQIEIENHKRQWEKRRNFERLQRQLQQQQQQQQQPNGYARNDSNFCSTVPFPSGKSVFGALLPSSSICDSSHQDSKCSSNLDASLGVDSTMAETKNAAAFVPASDSSADVALPGDIQNTMPLSNQTTLFGKGITAPGLNDVLLGRGKGFYQHTGNIRYRNLIESRSALYDCAKTSAAKKKLTYEVIELVKKAGGRFLKDDPQCGWFQVDDEMARQKVAHVFRSLRGGGGSSGSSSHGGIGTVSLAKNATPVSAVSSSAWPVSSSSNAPASRVDITKTLEHAQGIISDDDEEEDLAQGSGDSFMPASRGNRAKKTKLYS